MGKSFAMVLSNREIAHNIYSLEFEITPEISKSTPGQFINIRVRGEDAPFFRRPFSIAGTDDESAEIIYEVVGRGTYYLSLLETGDSLDILGPLGSGFRFEKENSDILLIGGGIGLPPLLFLAQTMSHNGISPMLLAGFRTKSVNYLPRDTDRVLYATNDGTLGHNGYITDLLTEKLRDKKYERIYACGPDPMLSKVIEIADEFKASCSVSVENVFGCGTGLCLGCIMENSLKRFTETGRKYALACKDGPVFDASDLIL